MPSCAAGFHTQYERREARHLKHEHSNHNHQITLYAGPQFEQIIDLKKGETVYKYHIADYLTITRNSNYSLSYHYRQNDRLGSTTQITEITFGQPQTVHQKNYDVFGKPRNADLSPMPTPALNFTQSNSNIEITKRGFTGHEHLDAFQLIHMNGRVYDFNNGRFLSVDPFIQGLDSQAINPYTYIHNNPLAGVDPTGYVVIWDRDECEKEKSSGACNEEVAILLGQAKPDNGKKVVQAKSHEIHQQDVSDIELLEDCEGLACQLFKDAKENGGFIFFVTDLDGTLIRIRFEQKYSSWDLPELNKGWLLDSLGTLVNNASLGVNEEGLEDSGVDFDSTSSTATNVASLLTGSAALARGAWKVGIKAFGKGGRSGTVQKVDYSSIKNPPNIAPGKNFTARQKKEAVELNKQANGGVVRSDLNGEILVRPKKSQRGVTPSPKEWQIDHKTAKRCGGTNCSSNIQILSRKQNRDKSDN